MKLTIVAATGATGRHVLEQALAAGHEVTAVVRSPEKLPSGVLAVKADMSAPDVGALEAAVAGADAVVSALGATGKADAGVATAGTNGIIAAMRVAGTGRLVVLSAAPIGTVRTAVRPDKPRYDPGEGLFMRPLTALVKRALAEHYADLASMEDAVRDSHLAWTIVRPPRLTDVPAKGVWRSVFDANPKGAWTLGRADLAAMMLGAASDAALVDRVVGVSY